MKKREKIEDLLKLVEGVPLHPYKAPGAVQKIEDLLNLSEGLPLHDYEAPGAEKRPIELIDEKTGVRVSLPGNLKHYNSGYGILLCEAHRDSLIKCLRHILYGKRGAPRKDERDRLNKAFADRWAFEKVLAILESAGIKAPKTRAHEIFEKKWGLTNRQVRNRVSSAFKLAPF